MAPVILIHLRVGFVECFHETIVSRPSTLRHEHRDQGMGPGFTSGVGPAKDRARFWLELATAPWVKSMKVPQVPSFLFAKTLDIFAKFACNRTKRGVMRNHSRDVDSEKHRRSDISSGSPLPFRERLLDQPALLDPMFGPN